MEQRASDVREILLERVFPELRYGEDPDIERYFDLRAQGRMLDALSVYRRRLVPRYPDEARRVVLLRLYRTHSPAYPGFLREMLLEQADKILVRVKAGIDALVAPLVGVAMRDTYAVLKAVERVARLLPDDGEAARSLASAYADYARLLGHRREEAERAAYLLGEFYDQASLEEEAPTDFVASSLAAEETKRRKEREEERKNFFDLDKIEFDKADVARIEIPASLSRDEDMVLAYCHKYWLKTEDPAFERIVWLYSRKYGTRHYDVFKAIKTGRRKKYQDDDVLTMVATTIATRYSYTVQGDLYMQAAWRTIKASLYAQATPSRQVPSQASARGSARATPQAREPAAARVRSVRPRRSPSGAKSRPPAPLTQSAPSKRPERPRATPSLVRAPRPKPLARQAGMPAPERRVLPELKPGGSISDRIKRLSGRAYDVYREVFLAKVRGSIRDELLSHRAKSSGTFRDGANEAENIVYDYVERNYANAYMDWPSSEHRARVRELGFDLESLDAVIESCYRKIEA